MNNGQFGIMATSIENFTNTQIKLLLKKLIFNCLVN